MKLKQNIAVSESGFVFNATLGDSFTTNPIGVFIFNQLKEGKTEAQIVKQVTTNYEVDNSTCEKDVYDFLNMLKQYNLVD
ncbi:MAG: PqqD family protein [Saprospiraceae bacterium]